MFLFELCSRGTLFSLCETQYNNFQLAENQIIFWFGQILSGVSYLHSLQVRHRALKLENVLIGDDGSAKLCDFGSCSTDPPILSPHSELSPNQYAALTSEIERCTTLIYRAPELADLSLDLPISVQCDIWSLGCMLFALMFGEQCFTTLLSVLNVRYQVPGTLLNDEGVKERPPRSDKLLCLLHGCLAREPGDRLKARSLKIEILEKWETIETVPVAQSVADRLARDKKLYGVRVPDR